jgi:23S rRNA pseudouridine1911/1915/1917 synthase
MKQTTKAVQIQIIIPIELKGMRLDQALSQLLPDYSRERLKKWIIAGYIKINNIPGKPRDKVKGDEIIHIDALLEPELEWQPEPIALHIVYEDDELIVIDKPAGIVVHPGAGNKSHTLLNALLHHAPLLENIPRAGIVHRIDKDTSGLLVIAKTLPTHHYLIKSMQNKEIKRDYIAIVNGVMTAGGTINKPIGRHYQHRTMMAVHAQGKPAVTHYRVMEKFRAHTLISVQLETGRTHQIRVHMTHIRHPLIGDKTYGKRLLLPKRADKKLIHMLQTFPRQALHAHQLSFHHPKNQQLLTFTSPLPNDMQCLLAELRLDMHNN